MGVNIHFFFEFRAFVKNQFLTNQGRTVGTDRSLLLAWEAGQISPQSSGLRPLRVRSPARGLGSGRVGEASALT